MSDSQQQIKNITEASAAAAKFVPPSLTLSDGVTVSIGKIPWLQFEDLFADLTQVISLDLIDEVVSAAGSVGADDPDRESRFNSALSEAMQRRLGKAPLLMRKLIQYSTGRPNEHIDKLPFQDVLRVAQAAVAINFFQDTALMDFFGGIASAFQGRVAGAGEQKTAKATRKQPTKSSPDSPAAD